MLLPESVSAEKAREVTSDILIIAGMVAAGFGIHALAGISWTLIYAGAVATGFGCLIGLFRGRTPE